MKTVQLKTTTNIKIEIEKEKKTVLNSAIGLLFGRILAIQMEIRKISLN